MQCTPLSPQCATRCVVLGALLAWCGGGRVVLGRASVDVIVLLLAGLQGSQYDYDDFTLPSQSQTQTQTQVIEIK